MKVSLIQTGTVSIHRRQVQGAGPGAFRLINTILDREWTEPLPIFAWVIEHPEGVVVVDTGETGHSSEPGYFPWWHPYFRFGVRCYVKPDEEIGPQMKALGLSTDDVRYVVLTHLHTDHAGGLHHFPKAEVIISRREYEAARGLVGRLRGFLNNRWPDWLQPRLIDFTDPAVGPFPRSFILTEAGDISLVPTPGHTAGHMSVILRDGDERLVFAGDASYTEPLMLEQKVDGVSVDVRAARRSLRWIAEFARQFPTVYLPAHDPGSRERFETRPAVSIGPDQ